MSALAEVVWLQDWLGRTYKAAPKRQWRHAAYSSAWDAAYIRQVMREDATADSTEIWRAVREHEDTNSWPKLSGRAAHFLRERLLAAGTVCDAWRRQETRSSLPEPAKKPLEAEKLLHYLLVEHWDTTAVDYWLDGNVADFQEHEYDPHE